MAIHSLKKTLKQPSLVWLLITANVVIYVSYGFTDFDTITLFNLGANFAPLSLDKEYYRLVAAMFLHGGIFHLGFNMYSLFVIGTQIEQRFGPIQFAYIYFFTGIIASLSGTYFNLFQISVGASGAIFGLYGYELVTAFEKGDWAERRSIVINFGVYMVVMFFVGQKLNFDNAGHIGGVLAGFSLRFVDRFVTSQKLIIAGSIVLLMLLFYAHPKYQVDYYKAYQELLNSDEKMSMVLQSTAEDQEFLLQLKNIQNLPDSIRSQFASIEDMPGVLQQDTTYINRYLSLRKQQLSYYIICIEKERFIYIDSIAAIAQAIANVPNVSYHLNFKRTKAKKDTTMAEQFEPAVAYYDKDWFITDSENASFFRQGTQDSLGDWHGFVIDYYADGLVQMQGKYHHGLKNGIFVYYNELGGYSSAGRYLRDIPFSKWEYFHRNGRLTSEIRNIDGYERIENMWDSLGNQIIKHGRGTIEFYHNNGRLKSRRFIVDGLNQGISEGYYKDGKPFYKEYYDQGELINGISYADGTTHHYDKSTFFSYPVGGYDDYRNYLKKANKLASDTIDEQVVIAFTVKFDGKINNLRFLKRSLPTYNDYAKKLLLDGPSWIPGNQHGHIPVNSYGEVRIDF